MTAMTSRSPSSPRPPTTSSWLICSQPQPQPRLRLFCLPYAGGGASIYRAWAAQLPSEIETYAVQLPGRESRLRETPFTQVGPLVRALAEAILPALTTPFALFGHSMGALISFELTRYLRREYGLGPAHLFVSGRIAPHSIDPLPPAYGLPHDEFIERLRHLNGTPPALLQNAELMRMVLPILRADFAINEAYSYGDAEPFGCPISAFGGLDDPKANADDLKQWQRHTRAAFSLRMLPGDHFFINSAQQPLVQAVSHDLRQTLHQIV